MQREKTPKQQLIDYLEACRPIIYINYFDFEAVDKMIIDATDGCGYAIEEYSEALGHIHYKTKNAKSSRRKSLAEFLSDFDRPQHSKLPIQLLVLKEVHAGLSDPRVISLLQTIAQRTKRAGMDDKYRVQVVIVDSQLCIPPELENLITAIEFRPPDENRIREIIEEEESKTGIKIDDGLRREMVQAFKGLSEFEMWQMLSLAEEKEDIDREEVLALIHDEKWQKIRKSNLLEFVEAKAGDVGGLENLNSFVDDAALAFKHPGLARECGVEAPAGILIVGMPGCGKSLMAKTVAKKLEVPLLKLDVGRLMGKYVGESEHNLQRAISIAESVSPCVLWIDEIEKAFSGIGGNGGGGSAMTRMFGIFLTWMQEKTASVYVVATANNLDLPPEFLRKGRFDEIFKVVYPNREECEQILGLHIKRRNGNKIPSGVDVKKVLDRLMAPPCSPSEKPNRYSGADIESIVKEAMRRLFVDNMRMYGEAGKSEWEPLTTALLLKVIKETNSSYKSCDEVTQAKLDTMLKRLDNMGARSASKGSAF